MDLQHNVDGIDFEWDSEKAASNLAKHEVSFEEASQVFLDPFVRVVDAREVDDEAREAVIGLTKRWTLLYVAYVWRKAIRLISARKATNPERRIYEEQ